MCVCVCVCRESSSNIKEIEKISFTFYCCQSLPSGQDGAVVVVCRVALVGRQCFRRAFLLRRASEAIPLHRKPGECVYVEDFSNS